MWFQELQSQTFIDCRSQIVEFYIKLAQSKFSYGQSAAGSECSESGGLVL